MKRLTEKQKEEILQRAANGEAQADIARDFHTSPSNVSRVIVAARNETMAYRAKNTMMSNFKNRAMLCKALGLVQAAKLFNMNEQLSPILEEIEDIVTEVIEDEC